MFHDMFVMLLFERNITFGSAGPFRIWWFNWARRGAKEDRITKLLQLSLKDAIFLKYVYVDTS